MIAERNPQVERAVVKLRVLSSDERARDMLERREKAHRDFAMLVDDAEKRGRTEGRTEGRIEGRTEGRTEERIAVARNAIKMGMKIDAIVDLTGLSREEIESLSAR